MPNGNSIWKKALLFTAIATAVHTTLPCNGQEAYTYDSYYYRRAALFEILPTDTSDIIMLGNSLTDGCEWHELLQDNRIKNRGITADVMAGINDRLPAILKGKPAKIFIMAGINDISHDLSADSISGMLWDIVAQIHRESPATRIYVQSLLPVNTDMGYKRLQGKEPVISRLNELLQAQAGSRGYQYIELHSHFTAPGSLRLDPRYTNDGLHLTAEGYLLWGELLRPFIKE